MARELLFSITRNDFEVQTFRSGGPGGQNQNKRETGVRIIHKDSGAIGEARDGRDQLLNKKNAFKRLIKSDKFQSWLKKECSKYTLNKQVVEDAVEKLMNEKYLKVEYGNP